MKTCPLCKNKGWPETALLSSPVIGLGGKINSGSGSIRRYVCLNCLEFIHTSETVLAHAKATDNQLQIAKRLSKEQIELVKERLNITDDQSELFDLEEMYGQLG